MRRSPRALQALLLFAALVLTGCSGGEAACTEETRKAAVLSTAREWYLYQDLLRTDIDPASYATADDLLAALTQPAYDQGKDRGWSYLLTGEQYQQYFTNSQSTGFGFGLLLQGDRPNQRLFVGQVFPGSAAVGAGFIRGDEILSLGPDAQHLTSVVDLLNDGSPGSLGDLLGPSTAGVTRTFSVIPAGGTAAEIRILTKAAYDLDPVPEHWIDANKIGYVNLRTFIASAEPLLRSVFQEFKDAGVQNLVVDLRYNGGGLVDTARILANLLAAGQSGQKMFDQQFNTSQSGQNRTYSFGSETAAGTFTRIAFITTSSSASASELVPNSLDPYLDVAFVGAKTYGKPVGQYVFTLSGCDRKLFLVSFKTVNASGVGDYYDGLPVAGTSRGPLCQAEDDLTHSQGEASEASTQAAIYFARNGSCPPATTPMAMAAQKSAGRPPTSDTPRPSRPSPEQVDIPGLF